jgi:DNA (cytosine-5)-methyltransferase 1
MNELALFAGAGGGILGGHLLGWRTVCAVEWEPYAASVLAQRQNDGLLPAFPIWDDVRTFDGRPWRGVVDVVSGGFPCQDVSASGKGTGLDGQRSGLWSEMARVVGEVRPRFVFVENSPLLVGRGLVRVLADLATMGFDARWGVVGACHAGAPHERERLWLVAHANGSDSEPEIERQKTHRPQALGSAGWTGGSNWWDTEPPVGRVADGVDARVDRLKAIGNGQVPHAAALAWHLMTDA